MPFKQNINSISQFIKSKDRAECQAPAVGDYRDIDIEGNESLTKLGQRYRLKTVDENSYEVILNVKFYTDTGATKKGVNDNLTVKWRKAASECLSKTAGKLLGPDGEKIALKIYDGPDDSSAPPDNIIGIRNAGRAHSKSWTEDMEKDCPVVLHELLHLTGLVDEYPESTIGYVKDELTGNWKFVQTGAEKTAYDCRKLYEKNSVMADHNIAWTDAFASFDLLIDYCDCEDQVKCDNYFENQKIFMKQIFLSKQNSIDMKAKYPETCPDGFIPGKYHQVVAIPDQVKKEMDSGKAFGMSIPKGMSTTDVEKMPSTFNFKEKKSISFLEPRHFNTIVFAGCLSKNQNYYQDSMNAYRTSQKNGGAGCANLNWSTR